MNPERCRGVDSWPDLRCSTPRTDHLHAATAARGKPSFITFKRSAKVAQIDLFRQLTEAIWYMLTRNQPFKPFAPAGAIFALTA